MNANDISAYYDELHLWTQQDAAFQTFSGLENDAIHRFLIDETTGQFSPETIYRFVDPFIPGDQRARGLDAGSGYGGACFRNHRVHGGRWAGVTISQQQWLYATKLAKARDLDEYVSFHLQSYDDALPGRFNFAIAIESLVHSPDPARTLTNLAGALDAGGRLVIVDDMPCAQLSPADAEALEEFRRCWRCPATPAAREWTSIARTAGLRLIEERDLSALMRPRDEANLDAALDDLCAQRQQKSAAGFERLSDAEIGGLHLERLQRRGAMRYMLLAFEK